MSDQSSSLVSLCEKEEWKLISGLIPTMIHSWNLEEKNGEGNNPLIICCMKGAWHVLQQLYFSKSKIIYPDTTYKEDTSVLLFACYFGHLDVVKWLLQNECSMDETSGEGYSCLLIASTNGHLETIKWLLENGCSFDDRYNNIESCLLLAATYGHSETVKWLFQKRMSIWGKSKYW